MQANVISKRPSARVTARMLAKDAKMCEVASCDLRPTGRGRTPPDQVLNGRDLGSMSTVGY